MKQPEPSGARPGALPEGFVRQLDWLSDADQCALIESFGRPRSRGLRANPAKITPVDLKALVGIPLAPVPWCPTGFSFDADHRLGDHPAHLAGLFYLQEPSAMSPAEVLAPEPGWSVIDLAASPGGKTTHLAALVGPSGLVVANEVAGHRLAALHDNIDRWGAGNVVTCSLPLDRLAATGAQFDAALLDAPCSGEALFRRDPTAVRHWSPAAVAGAARRQAELLQDAARLVRPGGVLVYSTCTFNLAENEQQVAAFLAVAGAGVGPDDLGAWVLDDCSTLPGAAPGYPVGADAAPTERNARFWPHLVCGEGQFVARLRRIGQPDRLASSPSAVSPSSPPPTSRRARRRPGPRDRDRRPGRGTKPTPPDPGQVLDAWDRFRATAFVDPDRFVATDIDAAEQAALHVQTNRLYAQPRRPLPLPADRLARPGLPLGRLRPGRFEPHPALATFLGPDDVTNAVDWDDDRPELAAYRWGETVHDGGADGWVLVCYRGWGLGWARRSGGVLKNFLPRSRRDRR